MRCASAACSSPRCVPSPPDGSLGLERSERQLGEILHADRPSDRYLVAVAGVLEPTKLLDRIGLGCAGEADATEARRSP